MGRGPVVTVGVGVVGDELLIGAELVEAVAGAVHGRSRWCVWRDSRRLERRGLGAGGRGGRCPGRGAAREPGEGKPMTQLLGHSGMVVWCIGGGHDKWSEARGRAEAGQAEMGVGSEEVGIRFGAQACDG
jgi:hypothetical protein